jgi:signal transduction histidine kinase
VLAKEKGLELKKAGEFPSVRISGDATHMRRLFYNIIDNAVKFTPSGGFITVGMALDSGRARVSISDTGPGIPPEDLKRIFEPFYRASLDSEKTQGTGLGLSMARTIAEFHGGDIHVESRENRGTTFFVDLPALPDQDQPSS